MSTGVKTPETTKGNTSPNHGENVRKARRLRGFNQEDLARELGMGKSTVSGWENKKILPDEILTRIGQALGIEYTVLRDFDLSDTSVAPPQHFQNITSRNANTILGNHNMDLTVNDAILTEVIYSQAKMIEKLVGELQKDKENITELLKRISEKL